MVRKIRNRIRRAMSRVNPRLRLIPQMKMEVCSPCHNDCQDCAHLSLRLQYAGFQLTIADLKEFIEATERSGYVIGLLSIHGPGEPLLWKHFNLGIKLLAQSKAICDIQVTTNGHNLEVIAPSTWKYISLLRISVYANLDQGDKFKKILKSFKNKVMIEEVAQFAKLPRENDIIPVPCECICDGPMFMGDKIFYYCGPPLYNAATLMGLDPEDDGKMWTYVEPNYLENYDARRKGALKYCQHCWANGNFERQYEAHRPR